MKRFIPIFAVTLLSTALPCFAAERVALVIGNNAYRFGTPLSNCINDAEAMAKALKEVGFEVIVAKDASLEQMEAKLIEFRRVAQGAKAAWFFYSGHGVEVKGANYLVPVDAEVKEEFQIKHKAFALDQVMGAMEDADTPLKVVVLDCCRDNPFGKGWSRSGARGLGQVGETPKGTIIAFATAPGKVAADGDGKNSPFTTALVASIARGGLEIDQVFKETGRAVLAATANEQQPWINSSYFDSFVLSGGNSKESVTPPESAKEAFTRHRKGAELNDSSAMNCLGECYLLGEGVTKDLDQAAKWFRKGANLNHPAAIGNLGYCFAIGSGVPEDQGEAIKWYRKAADLNDPDGTFNLAYSYETGVGVPKDLDKAVKLYHKAADLNQSTAMYWLGHCYEVGNGINKDLDEAARWYRKAADLNNSNAMRCLGECYLDGVGVPKDLDEAVKWFQKGADLNNSDAMLILGSCYLRGEGVFKNPEDAAKWFRKAAELNQPIAMRNLSVCYQDGIGVPKDLDEAANWRKRADEAAKK